MINASSQVTSSNGYHRRVRYIIYQHHTCVSRHGTFLATGVVALLLIDTSRVVVEEISSGRNYNDIQGNFESSGLKIRRFLSKLDSKYHSHV